jgi:hypothetical protein
MMPISAHNVVQAREEAALRATSSLACTTSFMPSEASAE